MTQEELRELMKARLAGWRELDAFREAERDRELPKTHTPSMLGAFNGMVLRFVRDCPPEPWSGLIEQQHLFSKAQQAIPAAK